MMMFNEPSSELMGKIEELLGLHQNDYKCSVLSTLLLKQIIKDSGDDMQKFKFLLHKQIGTRIYEAGMRYYVDEMGALVDDN